LEDHVPLQTAAVNQPIRRLQSRDVAGRETVAAQADQVQTHDAARGPVDHRVGGDILDDAGVAAHHRQSSDSAKLVDADGTGDKGAVVNAHVPGQERVVGNDDLISQVTVVGNVRTDH